MPETEAVYQVMPLSFLGHKAISINRAKELDNEFFISIIKENSTPEFNGFNTRVLRMAGYHCTPATTVCYVPLINLNPAHPDTVQTSMNQVKKMSEDMGKSILCIPATSSFTRYVSKTPGSIDKNLKILYQG